VYFYNYSNNNFQYINPRNCKKSPANAGSVENGHITMLIRARVCLIMIIMTKTLII